VGDTEQPAFRVVDDTEIRQRGKSLNQRVLNNVLAIDGGAGHARAVSMELWSKLTHQPFEFARIVSYCSSSPRVAAFNESYVERQDVAIVLKAQATSCL
jgi:hypothetical protein